MPLQQEAYCNVSKGQRLRQHTPAPRLHSTSHEEAPEARTAICETIQGHTTRQLTSL